MTTHMDANLDRHVKLAAQLEYLMAELGTRIDDAHTMDIDRIALADWLRASLRDAFVAHPDIWEDFLDGTLELIQRT